MSPNKSKKKPSQVRSYPLDSIIRTSPGSPVKSANQTTQKFYALYENNFLVLPDGKTVVGADASNPSKLVSEDITTNTSRLIGTLSNTVYTVVFDPKSRSLFAGDHEGCLRMYQEKTTSGFFVLVKDFGNVGIGRIWSSTLGFGVFRRLRFVLSSRD